MRNRKKSGVYETSVLITATVCIASILSLLIPITRAATELRLNETRIQSVETTESSAEVENALKTPRDETRIYNDAAFAEKRERK